MGKLLLTIGLAGLCHAAYSATQHRNYLRLTESSSDFSASSSSHLLPVDILVQTLVCLLLCCFGVISIAAKFKPIQITSEWENKVWDNIGNRTSFYSFNHRGKFLFASLDEHRHHESHLAADEEENAHERELYRKKLLERNHQKKIQEQQRLIEQQRLLEQQKRAEENSSGKSKHLHTHSREFTPSNIPSNLLASKRQSPPQNRLFPTQTCRSYYFFNDSASKTILITCRVWICYYQQQQKKHDHYFYSVGDWQEKREVSSCLDINLCSLSIFGLFIGAYKN